ncbi:MAG: tRNA (adenosine(37)-N6)-threonylcarbamoyltransferase complex ATPase subunit type 1 TsaE [Oligoflexia bacterium]|nr:tRNA (adenosine(37)-N6)-threonylcarbamoyltransferase complex ATPase subunit type 1 TsaE [Oligoflexia bacterium]
MILLKNIKETQKHAESIAKKIKAPAIILLSGPLGSGKTQWVSFFIKKYLNQKNLIVNSPSYSLVNEYKNKSKTVIHMDLYRLSKQDDFESIGLRDYLNDKKNIICIEWSENLNQSISQRQCLKLKFEIIDENKRQLSSSFEGGSR